MSAYDTYHTNICDLATMVLSLTKQFLYPARDHQHKNTNDHCTILDDSIVLWLTKF